MMTHPIRLGINIDHVATIRNARGGFHPDPVRAAALAAFAGADGITIHLREDRRHINDSDVDRLRTGITLPLNLEMAATREMLKAALHHRPHAVCLVPERREEITTEGGLNVARVRDYLPDYINTLTEAGIRVSLFIDPDPAQLDAAAAVGAPVIELHTGSWCNASGKEQKKKELQLLQAAAARAEVLGLECHAGHGLNFDTVGPVAAIPTIAELNIGHFLVGEAVFIGLDNAIRQIRAVVTKARNGSSG
jgi:pyridoxine 5-phosphate synthase